MILATQKRELQRNDREIEALSQTIDGMEQDLNNKKRYIKVSDQQRSRLREKLIPIIPIVEPNIYTYNAAYESMSGQFGLFETAAAEVTLSTDQMIAAMMSQSEYMSTYSENLRLAAQYGITDGLVAALSDGSTQSAGYLQAIVAEIEAAGGAASEGGQKIVQGLNEAFSAQQQSLETYATGVADANTKIDEKMQELVDNTTAAVSDLDMSDEAKTSAENTLNGFVAGIDSGSGALLERMTQLASDAIAAFNAGLEVKSPSRATKRSAAYTVQGFVDEIKKQEAFVKQTMQELGKTAVNSFSVDLNARSAEGSIRSGANVSNATTVNIYPQQMDEAMIDYVTREEFEELKGMIVNGKQFIRKNSKSNPADGGENQ